jgi:Mrp family chromosome partitioning ATPase
MPVSFGPDSYTKYLKGPKAAWKRLTEVPLDPVVLSRNMLVASQPCDASMPFDILRTRILAKMKSNGERRLAITAPTAGCGKSTFVGNLALSLARKQEIRTLVFDFDFRSPSLIRKFGLEEIGPRFSALSGTRRNFDSTCLRVGSNLALSLNNTKPSNPAELLGSQRTRDLMEQIENDFQPDLILIDLPPLLPVDDARAALEMVDRALIVAMADVSTQAEVDQAQLIAAEHGKSLGVVLNKCRFPMKPTRAPKKAIWRSGRAAAI